MKRFIILALLFSLESAAQAATLSASVGKQTWKLGGNALKDSAQGYYTKGVLTFDKTTEDSLLETSLAVKFSSAHVRPDSSNPVFNDQKNLNISLIQWGPVLCAGTHQAMNLCASVGLVEGMLSQTNGVRNSFVAPYASLGVKSTFYQSIFMTLDLDVFKFQERQYEQKINLQAKGLSIGLGTKF